MSIVASVSLFQRHTTMAFDEYRQRNCRKEEAKTLVSSHLRTRSTCSCVRQHLPQVTVALATYS
ncbi:TPA: hypothetical protein N0F65_011286 [Lagenidium giganteum]|uniref:Uncharacterized protein n=1 Tax=Lagenidium giganteum TaxID=4803 RepID=A0AAV2YQX1_9STRA|nr:TPA: hypothetical protein N0F65_011286 [Lagenidium giganteum]